MVVRPAELVDLNACYEMDTSYVTEYVWQMQSREDDRSVEVRFNTIRLPRPMKVFYPRHPDELLPNWRQQEHFSVAEDESGQVIAYLDMAAQDWHQVGWIRNLVVERHHRRQGVATSLLRSVHHWALERGLNRLIIEAQTKNYPAIKFSQEHGFVYCGYNDHYYVNGDIAVFFSLGL